MALPIPCSGQELAQTIVKMRDDIESLQSDCDIKFNNIVKNGSHIGDLLNTYRTPGDKYLLCNGATIENEDEYSELIALLGGNVLPTISVAYGYTYIKAKE